MVTEAERAQAPLLRAQDARLRRRVPLLTGTAVAELLGHGRLSGVRVRHRDGRTAELACDTVVFTGDFVPESELARRGGVTVDAGGTSRPGVFAVGGLVRPGESAAGAARSAARVAAAVMRP
jgi:thioredoxin reductase